MIDPRKLFLAGAAIAVGLGLAGCGERDQVTVYKQGKYQGKPDNKPWENDPAASLYTTSKWTPGDKTSWESALRTRNLAQNEYNRVQ
jgi:hypothetical protein